MGNPVPATVVSVRAVPTQVAHLCFEVGGILGSYGQQLLMPAGSTGMSSDWLLGAYVNPFDLDTFYGTLAQMPTVSGDPSRLLYDFLQIQAYTASFTIASLRAEPRKAALDKAINARQNAFLAKYANQSSIISRIQENYAPAPYAAGQLSKPSRLALLAECSEKQWNALSAAYNNDTTRSPSGSSHGVVKTTSSGLTTDSISYGYSAASGVTNDSVFDVEADSETAFEKTDSQGFPTVPAGVPLQDFTPPEPPSPMSFPSPPQQPPYPSLTPPTPVKSFGDNWISAKGNTTPYSMEQATSYQTSSSNGRTQQAQTIVNTDYGYRTPYYEAMAQYERAQISLIDQQFAAFMQGQLLQDQNLNTVFTNEKNSMDSDVYRLQIAYLNTILTSPIPGIITGVYKHPGEAVKAGEPVFRVENNNNIYLVARLIYRGPIVPGKSTIKISTALLDESSQQSTSFTGSPVVARGLGADDKWEVILQCGNQDQNSNTILPLNYHFDYDNTTVTVS
jgi:biotin carboxyl carrier protein